MQTLAAIASEVTLAEVFSQVPDQAPEAYAWQADLEAELQAGPRGRGERMKLIAARHGCSADGARKKFDAYVARGVAGLVNRRHASKLWKRKRAAKGVSEADKELVRSWCEKFQRKNEPAILAMLEAWLSQSIPPELAHRGLTVPHTFTPLNPATGYPFGWSVRNLVRWAPAPVEEKAARYGLTAAKTEVPLVYTTRRDLYVGQFYMADDIWHDHEVVDLDQKKRGRPLEFHFLDLKSACKIGWGMRTRVESEFKSEGLKLNDFIFSLAHVLTDTGYHPTLGTTLIVENGTAAISDLIAKLLYDHTRGMINIRRAAMEGAAAHAAQYAGRSKGNFKIKAALESLGNLIHNAMAALPAQVGMDRDHCPAEMHDGGRFLDPANGKPMRAFGRNKMTDALLLALDQLPPEQAQWIQWDRCTIQQFRMIAERIYATINGRIHHNLEGWDAHYVPDQLGGMRRLSPREVFQAGRRPLIPISDDLVALLLSARGLDDLRKDGTADDHTVRQGMITVNTGEVSGDALRFQAAGLLPAGEKFCTVLNPFDPGRLFVFDAKDRFLATLPRIHSVCPSDVDAINRASSEKRKILAKELAGVRRRATPEARLNAARDAHNASLISGRPTTPEQKAQAVADRERALPLDAFRTSPSSTAVPASTDSDELGDL